MQLEFTNGFRLGLGYRYQNGLIYNKSKLHGRSLKYWVDFVWVPNYEITLLAP